MKLIQLVLFVAGAWLSWHYGDNLGQFIYYQTGLMGWANATLFGYVTMLVMTFIVTSAAPNFIVGQARSESSLGRLARGSLVNLLSLVALLVPIAWAMQSDTVRFERMFRVELEPWVESALVICGAAVLGAYVWPVFREWIGRLSKWPRRIFRLSKMGSGGSAQFGGVLEEWANRFYGKAMLLGSSYFTPGFWIGHNDDRGFLTISSSRSGKGRSGIIPNLLMWQGSALVIDPKGTNAAVTATRRGHGSDRVKKYMGQDVHILDPFWIVPGVKSAAFNPLEDIDLNARTVREDIGAVADALVVSSDKKEAHWDENAKVIISGMCVHLLWKAKEKKKPPPTLLDLRKTIISNAKTLDSLFGEMSRNSVAGGMAIAAAGVIRNAGARERGSFFTTIFRNTAWLDSVAMREVLGGSDFEIRALKEKPTSIYIVLPPDLLDEHSRFMRLFVNLAIKAIPRGGKSKHPILFCLDEFYALGTLSAVEAASGALAGYGVKLWPIIQNLGQLYQRYPQNWETFFANAGAVQVFGINDTGTSDYIVGRLGRQTVPHVVDMKTVEVVHNLRESDELGRDLARETGRQIILRSGDDPLLLKRINYDKGFSKRWYESDPDYANGRDEPPTPPPPPPPGSPSTAVDKAILNPVIVKTKAEEMGKALEKEWLKKKGETVEEPETATEGFEFSKVLTPEVMNKIAEDQKLADERKRREAGIKKQIRRATPENQRDPMRELEEMIGLDEVKNQVKTAAAVIRTSRQRRKAGLKETALSWHMVFTGNPGTGKTTVAKLIGSIFREAGLLKKGHLVAAERADLVAEYVGQTAPKTLEKCKEALDGVLFIDEAYSLVPEDSARDFGAEAIATLLTFMEENRDRVVVIGAGYKKEMDRFINSNPGLKSRFQTFIDFKDYDAVEMQEIFEMHCGDAEFEMSDEATKKVKTALLAIIAKKKKDFGNGRTARNLLEMCMRNHGVRMHTILRPTTIELMMLMPEDIPDDVSGIE